jgi:hypothetical protein
MGAASLPFRVRLRIAAACEGGRAGVESRNAVPIVVVVCIDSSARSIHAQHLCTCYRAETDDKG